MMVSAGRNADGLEMIRVVGGMACEMKAVRSVLSKRYRGCHGDGPCLHPFNCSMLSGCRATVLGAGGKGAGFALLYGE